ncbi:hypothetical protein J7I98_04290 [Streptomyces sp. ISL-98]|uniref:hypothetical protein n=1 Tax=Streptomyces sp. ISL-98 TaxID=2819192 RepID=UPI001BE75DA3|nr:hypothetical protein [Streptomyces sp. ISL-98]MBT2505127.1 hypothetical protein [Streptomyces sp. ISL-98]
MPWVRLDDRFPSHRKVALLSDRAFRLYVSALCWSSENLTEGRITDRELPIVTRLRGAKAAAKELEDARLWDRTEGGWSIHDYLEYNPDRARVQEDRAANAARQAAFRERKRAEREAARNGGRNPPSNGVTPDGKDGSERTTATRTRHDGDTTERRSTPEGNASSQATAFRNGVSNGPPSPPPTPSSPTEKKQASTPAPPDSDIPEAARPLVHGLTKAGVFVRWPFKGNDWFPLLALITKTGVPAMVDHAVKVSRRTEVESAKYFLNGWAELPPLPPAGTDRPPLRAVANDGWTPYQNPVDPSVYENGF